MIEVFVAKSANSLKILFAAVIVFSGLTQIDLQSALGQQYPAASFRHSSGDTRKSNLTKPAARYKARKANTTAWSKPARSSASTEIPSPAAPEPAPIEPTLEQAPTPAPEIPKDAGTKEKIDTAPEPSSSIGSDKSETAAPAGLLNQAAERVKNGEYPEALETYQTIINKGVASKDQKLMAAGLSGAARTLHKMGKDKEALENIDKSIAINLAVRNARARSLDYLLAGQIVMGQEKYADALKAFEEAHKILPVSEAGEIPKLLENTATCQLKLNRVADAIGTLNRLLSSLTKDGNQLESARILILIGEIQVSRSDNQAAKGTFKKAEKLYRDLGRGRELGETLFRIAYLDQASGDLETARKTIEEGQSFLDSEKEPATVGLPLMVRGLADHQ